MSMTVFGQGRIARGNLGPQEDFVTRNKNGEATQELFRRAHIFVPDRYAPKYKMEDGTERPQSQLVQLIFDSGPRHEKIFSWLHAGRQISFRGRLSHRARAYYDAKDLDEQGKPKLKVHANPTVYVERIDFLDSPVEHTANRFLTALAEAGKIDPKEKDAMVLFLKDNLQLGDDNDTPVKDKAGEAPKAEGRADIVEDDDPFEVDENK